MAEQQRKRVLVVDDDEGVREFVRFLLTQDGLAVETVVDGEEAARRVEEARPDLIVLDLMLPRYGGFELLRRLQEGPLRSVPVVVVTGRYTDTATAELIRQEPNVVELIEKPRMDRLLSPAVARGLALGPRDARA